MLNEFHSIEYIRVLLADLFIDGWKGYAEIEKRACFTVHTVGDQRHGTLKDHNHFVAGKARSYPQRITRGDLTHLPTVQGVMVEHLFH